MKTKLLLSLLLLFSLSAFAQIKFESGHYINNNDEKIEGFIKNTDWRNNPRSFEFKASETAEPETIGIDFAKAFSTTSFSYKRADVDIERSSNKIQYLGNHKEPQFVNERLFLKQLVSGTANLYKYEESGLEKFFYSVNNGPIKQLIYISYKAGDTDLKNNPELSHNDILVNDTFRRQLWYDVKCDASYQNKISNLKYKTEDLTKYFEAFNSCKGDVVTEVKTARKSKFNFKASAIYNMSNIDVIHTTARSAEFKNSSIGVGFEAEIILPFNNNKWGVIVEPSYNSFKDKQTLPPSGFSTTTQTVETDFKYIQVPLGVRYYFFLSDNSKIFVNLIGNIRLMSKETVDYSSQDYLRYGESTFSFAFGAGYSYKKFSGELRYFPKANISASYYPIEFSNTAFILRYELFGRK